VEAVREVSSLRADDRPQHGDRSSERPRLRSHKWWWVGALLVLLGLGGGYFEFAGREAAAFHLNAPQPPPLKTFGSALYQSVAVPLRPGHEIQILDNGSVFDTLVEDLEHATSSIHVLMYIWEPGTASDRVSRAIIDRARAGVQCRILVDAFGSSGFAKRLAPPLEQAGCQVKVFRPLPGYDKLARNHRKIVVIDGTVGFTGGFGIRDNWLGEGLKKDEWRDTQVRFRGPAVLEAQQAFAENWQEAGGELLPESAFPEPAALEAVAPEPAAGKAAAQGARAAFVSSTASSIVTRAERLTQLLIGFARQRIWISNAYFVPSDAILRLLADKAAQGVDVRVLVAGKQSDSKTSFGAQQFEYGSLVERGVRVWEYLPSMLHTKALLVDSELALVGSINLDPLSLNKLEEGALVVQDPAVNERLAQNFLRDCTRAKEQGKE
jgi:cardiolipin synthase